MGFWCKYFINGSELKAEDEEVSRGLKSWSKTECFLGGAKICHNHSLVIMGPGEYWQSETYETSTSELKPILIKYRIERKITAADTIYSTVFDPKETWIRIGPVEGWPARPLPPGSVGKWIILEYDLITKSVRTYFSSEKI